MNRRGFLRSSISVMALAATLRGRILEADTSFAPPRMTTTQRDAAVYISGDEALDGSYRIINHQGCIEQRINGIWVKQGPVGLMNEKYA